MGCFRREHGDHIDGARVDHGDVVDHDGWDRLVTVCVLADDRSIGGVLPDVVLAEGYAGSLEVAIEVHAEPAAGPPVEVDRIDRGFRHWAVLLGGRRDRSFAPTYAVG